MKQKNLGKYKKKRKDGKRLPREMQHYIKKEKNIIKKTIL